MSENQWTDGVVIIGGPAAPPVEGRKNLSEEAVAIGIAGLPNLVIANGEAAIAGGKDRAEKFAVGEKLEKKEAPLTKTEQFMVKALSDALTKDDLQGAVDALAALSDDPASAHRVLREVRKQVEQNKGTSMTFQTGRDQDNVGFASVQVHRPFDTLTATNLFAHVEPNPKFKYEK